MARSQPHNDTGRGDNADSPDESPLGEQQQQQQHQGKEGKEPELSSSPASPHHPPSLRSTADTPSMTPSSTPLGNINAARRPVPRQAASTGSTGLAEDIQAKMKAFSLSRQGIPHSPSSSQSGESSSPTAPPAAAPSPGPPPPPLVGGVDPSMLPNGPAVAGRVPPNAHLPTQMRPTPPNWSPTPSSCGGQGPPPMTPKVGGGGLAAKRGVKAGMKLSDAVAPPADGPENQQSSDNAATQGSEGGAQGKQQDNRPGPSSAFSRYSDMIDTKAGTLNFKNKAVIHGGGIEFMSGRSFKISLDDVDTLDELGKGNYGTVYKVRHCKPRIRRPGQGLGGCAIPPPPQQHPENLPPTEGKSDLSNVVMAMKEIRLELDDSKFTAIIMELDILHRCVSPFIIDFYGAFFQEGAVYICVEYMDGGSIEKLYADGVPEHILRKVALSAIMGLKELKDQHNIIHRDVKPTNFLLNTRGQVKICDFGVSGNLVASIAKTNVGCQSYMAPERIAGSATGPNPSSGTYSVQSDVWSLGLTLVECARGGYPYPPETYNNIFSQLNVSFSFFLSLSFQDKRIYC